MGKEKETQSQALGITDNELRDTLMAGMDEYGEDGVRLSNRFVNRARNLPANLRDTEFYLRGYLVGIMERDEMSEVIKMRVMMAKLRSEIKRSGGSGADRCNCGKCDHKQDKPQVVPTPKSEDDVHIS